MITTLTRRTQVTLTGAGQTIALPWYFLSYSDVTVTSTDLAGVDITLVLNTDYTMTGEGSEAGGSLTLTAGTAGHVVTIYSTAARTQPNDLNYNSQLSSAALEQMYDRLTILTQQLQADIERSIRVPVSNAAIAALTKTQRASTYLTFDANGLLQLVPAADVGSGGGSSDPYVASPPASPTAAGLLGQRAYSGGYIYECVVEGIEGAAEWVQYDVSTSW